MLVEHYGRLVGRQHMQKDRLHRHLFARRQMTDQRVQQQRSNAASPVALVNAQRQNVAHFRFLVRSRFGQNILVLLVQAHVRLDFGHNQTDNRRLADGGQRIESCARRDVDVPVKRVVDGEPVLAQSANLWKIETLLDLLYLGRYK